MSQQKTKTVEEETLRFLRSVEQKWQKRWDEQHLYDVEVDRTKESLLVTFPYPYVNGPLHLGHSFTCNKVDIYARFKRMQGYNVLFPFAFHATGSPISGVAERVAKGDQDQINTLRAGGVSEGEVEKFTSPEYIANYWRQVATESAQLIGWGIDWRRQFITIEPLYMKFIEWQYSRLREGGYVIQGTHNVIWCPVSQSPTGDHDRLEGEGATPVKFTLLKYPVEGEDLFLVAATFRPETIFGATNVWLNPEGRYVKARHGTEHWVVSKMAALKLQEQLHDVEVVEEFLGTKFIGKVAKNPLTGRELPVLPASFVDPEHSTGVVYSVPGHAPLDYLALRDLQQNPSRLEPFGVDPAVVAQIEPLGVIDCPDFKGPFPAVEVVEQLGVTSQNDPKAGQATDVVYKKEFHQGTMQEHTGKYAGIKVSEIKEVLTKDLAMDGIADELWEPSETVISRDNAKCIVKTLQNQWFIDYGNPNWKKAVTDRLTQVAIHPKEAVQAFEYTIDWLGPKACARRSGMGTKLPWDPDWIVETLSDSTVYMAFYTIIKQVREYGLAPEQLTPAFFDYVFQRRGDVTAVVETTNLTKEQLDILHEEFRYWYPVGLRISAKELIYNHLTFFLFHHIALWEDQPELWPTKIGAGGMLRIDNKKMSKSTGNFLTLKQAVGWFGADATRMGLAYADEGFNDPNFSRDETINFVEKLRSLVEQARRLGPTKAGEESTTKRHIDHWLEGRIHHHIATVERAYENLETRAVVVDAYFEFLNDMRWYSRRVTGKVGTVYHQAFEVMCLLLAPVVPHVAEEVWEQLGHKGSVFDSTWPDKSRFSANVEEEVYEASMRKLLDDIRGIMGLVREEKQGITLYVAHEWKYTVVNTAREVGPKQLMKTLMKDPAMRPLGKQLQSFAKKLPKDLPPFDVSAGAEVAFLQETDFLTEEFGLPVEVLRPEEVSGERLDPKVDRAEPLRPAIIIT